METVEDVIVRKLTAERVEELKKIIKETQEKYRYMTEALKCCTPESPVLKKLSKGVVIEVKMLLRVTSSVIRK